SLFDARLDSCLLHQADLAGAVCNSATLWPPGFDWQAAGVYLIGPNASLWGADLSDLCLMGGNLSHANLVGANLENTDLWGADLSGADLRDANLQSTILTAANLTGADLTGAALPAVSSASLAERGAIF
ncbi:MAG: pentapeptide repeat-containing protein, partial [Cyanobacteria bacterium J06628_6]